MNRTRPFLRWAGGKAGLVSRLLPYLPPNLEEATYHEPFLGAGSLYFAVSPARAVLGDDNPELIDCYFRVGTRPDLVWRHLRALMPLQSPENYYAIRSEFNGSVDSYKRAAHFIYLNRMCFNGIWRVNKIGQFNVPFGGKAKPGFPTRGELAQLADVLSGSTLSSGDFEGTIRNAVKGDFIYFDPPYLPLSATAYFRHYTANRFSTEDHERVALVAQEFASMGVNVLVTEGDSDVIRKWYKEFRIIEVDVRRSVSCGSERVSAQELIVTSY